MNHEGEIKDTRGNPKTIHIQAKVRVPKEREGEFTPIHGESLEEMDLLGEDGVDPAGEASPVGGDGPKKKLEKLENL